MAAAISIPDRADAPTLGFFDIARRLGCYARREAWTIAYIDGLIADYNFPRPFPLEHRGRWIETAHPKARWPRRAVDQWEHDRLPPDAAAAIDGRELADAGTRMDARAASLFAANDADFRVEFPATGGIRL